MSSDSSTFPETQAAAQAVPMTRFSDEEITSPPPDEEPLDIIRFDDPDSTGGYPAFPLPWKHPLKCATWMLRTFFGIAVLVVLLAVVAAVPLASLLVLGYLLEVEGRVGRTGQLRLAFPLLHRAPRMGTVLLGIGLWLLPVYLLAGVAADARLVDPQGIAAERWQLAKTVVAFFAAVHVCLALARGGRWGCFFRPIKNIRWLLAELRNKPWKGRERCRYCGELLAPETPDCPLCARRRMPSDKLPENAAGLSSPAEPQWTYWQRADEKVRRFFADFRLRHHLLLGMRGFAGALAFLIFPTILFAAAKSTEVIPLLLTLLGGILLAVVFLYVPFLQARLAVENRLSAMWELRAVRRLFRQAPLAWWIALFVSLALALPLYLFTAFAAPRDVQWLITLVFVMSIWPARVLCGWAYHRAVRKARQHKPPAWWGFRWGARLLMLATTVAYTFFFFFTRDISSRGRLVLFEHHAFLGTVLSSLFSLLP